MPFNLYRSCININTIGLFSLSLSFFLFTGSDNYFAPSLNSLPQGNNELSLSFSVISCSSVCHFCLSEFLRPSPLSPGSENDSGLPWIALLGIAGLPWLQETRGRGRGVWLILSVDLFSFDPEPICHSLTLLHRIQNSIMRMRTYKTVPDSNSKPNRHAGSQEHTHTRTNTLTHHT